MKRGDKVTRTLADKTYNLVYLGRGQFKTVYRDIDTGKVIVVGHQKMGGSIPEMECLAGREFDGLPHVTRLGYKDGFDGASDEIVYETEYIEDLKAKDHPEQWAVYKKLENLWWIARHETERSFERRDMGFIATRDGIYACNHFAEVLRGQEDIPEYLADAFQELADAMSNWTGGILYEFKKSAFGVKGDKLIPRDVAYDCALC